MLYGRQMRICFVAAGNVERFIYIRLRHRRYAFRLLVVRKRKKESCPLTFVIIVRPNASSLQINQLLGVRESYSCSLILVSSLVESGEQVRYVIFIQTYAFIFYSDAQKLLVFCILYLSGYSYSSIFWAELIGVAQ